MTFMDRYSDEEFLIKLGNALENCGRVSDSDISEFMKLDGKKHVLLEDQFAVSIAKRLRDISEKV